MVLDDGLVIQLPERNPVAALTGVLALQFSERLFERDLSVVDLRVPERPTLRLSPQAVERRAKQPVAVGTGGKDT
jgi:cell division protein FtsQ